MSEFRPTRPLPAIGRARDTNFESSIMSAAGGRACT